MRNFLVFSVTNSGSAIDNISQETIKNHTVFSPSTPLEQKRLVYILESIDRKIALNSEINRNSSPSTTRL